MRSPYSPPALIGSAVHAGTAAFDGAKLSGAPISVDDAAGVLIDTLRAPDSDVDWSGAKFTKRTAENAALALHVKYCNTIAPQFEYIAVEMLTTPLVIDCGGGTTVTLTGTLDRSRVRQGTDGIGISDLKTGARAVTEGRANTKTHRPQIGTYELLYEHTTGKQITAPGEIIGMSTSGSNEIATGEVHNARALMVGDDKAPGLIEIAAQMFRSGLFPPNPQSILCSKRYCSRWAQCPYHE